MTGCRTKARKIKVILELKTALPILSIKDKRIWQEAIQSCSSLFHLENEVISVKSIAYHLEKSVPPKKKCEICGVIYSKDDPKGYHHVCMG